MAPSPIRTLTKVGDQVSAYCNMCSGVKRHLALASYSYIDRFEQATPPEEPPMPDDNLMIYEILRCMGCDDISFRRETYSMETGFEEQSAERISFSDTLYGDDLVLVCDQSIQYPPRSSRQLPLWSGSLDPELRSILQEVYSALHMGLNRLAAMGARTIIDIVATREVGDKGSFGTKLTAMVTEGLVSKGSRDVIHAALEAGSAAAHRGHSPESDDLSVIMDIVENLLQTVYVLKPASDRLRASTPPRSNSGAGDSTQRIVPFRRLRESRSLLDDVLGRQAKPQNRSEDENDT